MYRVEYEKRFRQFENLPMPKIVDIEIEADIYPYDRRVETRSIQVLENRSNQEINAVHLEFPRDVIVISTDLEGGIPTHYDKEYNYYIFNLGSPMQLGEQREIQFK